MVSVDFCLSEVREGSYLQPGVCFDNNKSSKMTMNPFDEVQIAYSFVLSSFASPWMRETAQLFFRRHACAPPKTINKSIIAFLLCQLLWGQD